MTTESHWFTSPTPPLACAPALISKTKSLRQLRSGRTVLVTLLHANKLVAAQEARSVGEELASNDANDAASGSPASAAFTLRGLMRLHTLRAAVADIAAGAPSSVAACNSPRADDGTVLPALHARLELQAQKPCCARLCRRCDPGS